MHGPEVVMLGFFAMVTTIAIGLPFARALARRVDRDAAASKIPAEVTARLERMEQAIDAIAVEVERISEGQRFTTRLLAERGDATPAADGAVGTRGSATPGARPVLQDGEVR